ncbi:adenine deaminase [bacterium]|nr:adenine deaminase [bacterium]
MNARRKAWVDAAMGRIPCDLLIRGASYLDVFSLRWLKSDIAVYDGHVVAVDPGLKARRVIDAPGRFVVPGFVDAHVHVESSMLVPSGFERLVLPKGTTTAICDPHELANVQGLSGIQYFLDAASRAQLDLRVMLSSCVPATDFETNGAGHLRAADLLPLRAHPKALGLAEMMNFPGVLHGDPEVWEKLSAFEGAVIDGHCPLLRGASLSAYAAAGISSCHESTQLEEAREKLTKGMAVWIREGSVTKDLKTLVPLISEATSACLGFCTDDRNPLDIAEQGHLDFLVREAIAQGAPIEAVYRLVSWTVARHYGLRDRGAVAPGHRADLIVLGDAKTCAIEKVLVGGRPVDELEWASEKVTSFPSSVRAKAPAARDLEGPAGRVHVIGVKPGKIITERLVEDSTARGVARLTVLERYGKGSPPANAYVRGFGDSFQGAIASSVGHDSHNLIAVGSSTQDMAVAFAKLIEMGGGYCVVTAGQVRASLELPLGGLMTAAPAADVRARLQELRTVCRQAGCALTEPFLQLAFLSLPVIPSLKLTDRGLFDVDAFAPIAVRAS